MPMTAVKSSNISHIDHNPEANILTLRFHTGNRYTYEPFTGAQFEQLKSAPSIGKYFSLNIRNNPALKVTPLGGDEVAPTKREGDDPELVGAA